MSTTVELTPASALAALEDCWGLAPAGMAEGNLSFSLRVEGAHAAEIVLNPNGTWCMKVEVDLK